MSRVWNISATKKGTRGVLGPPRRSQICHQKVPNLTSEGPKLYLRSNNGIKKEENAWLCLHNASLEGPELFGPPKILAQLRLWYYTLLSLLHFVEANLSKIISYNLKMLQISHYHQNIKRIDYLIPWENMYDVFKYL